VRFGGYIPASDRHRSAGAHERHKATPTQAIQAAARRAWRWPAGGGAARTKKPRNKPKSGHYGG